MSLKAFDLVHVTDNTNLGGEKAKGTISCLEVSLDNLYIGTTDCFLTHFCIGKGISPSGKTTFMNKLQRHKHLGLRKPLNQLLACSAVGLLLILSDNNIFAVSMIGLELRNGLNKEMFKGVTVMARNEKPPIFDPDEVQICLGLKRKAVQVITLSKERVIVLKEINLPDAPTVMSFNAQTICTTLGYQYCLINYVTSAIQELFIYENHNVLPLIKCIGHEEFLLNGPTNSMGMIVTSSGLSRHQPLIWSDGVCSVACSYPYILVLGNTTVTIHSLIDQQQKQAMAYTGGVLLDDFDGQVFIAMQKSVMSFIPTPFSKQIQLLLIDKRVEEVFDMLLVASKIDPKQYSPGYIKQIQSQAAFIYFEDNSFDHAFSLFVESNMDARELIVLFPLMMPGNKPFSLLRSSLHSIKDLASVLKGSKSAFKDAKNFLMRYLEVVRGKQKNICVEIDTALAKLYIESNSAKLLQFLSEENHSYPEETFSWLTQFKRFHCLALYYSYLNQPKSSMDIWHKLLNNVLTDPNFPGISCVINFLSQIEDIELVLENMFWVLEKDQIASVQVFIAHTKSNNSERIYEYLQKHSIALQMYLEHLIFAIYVEKEAFHTHLALIYVNQVLKLLQDKIQIANDIESARNKLQHLLEFSSLYRISTLLQKISGYPLYKETAILYGKLDQHDKALKILVYKLKDFKAAERYCDVISKHKNSYFKQRIFNVLVSVYLSPKLEDGIRPEHLVMPLVELLNTRQSEFNSIEVLNTLPNDWSVDLIQPFLLGALRCNLSQKRNVRIESQILRQHFLQAKYTNIFMQHDSLKLTEDSCCDSCRKPYTEPVVARYPNNKCVHPHCCKDKHTCPVTGKPFR